MLVICMNVFSSNETNTVNLVYESPFLVKACLIATGIYLDYESAFKNKNYKML